MVVERAKPKRVTHREDRDRQWWAGEETKQEVNQRPVNCGGHGASLGRSLSLRPGDGAGEGAGMTLGRDGQQ